MKGNNCSIIDGIDFNKLSRLLLLLFAFFALAIAFGVRLTYAEIDSNALPVISIQYRGSILINEGDIRTAQADFPSLYQNINTYDDLRSAKLVKVTEEDWRSYYFPIYPALCIPLKILFSYIGIAQERTFSVTNALLVLLALYSVYKWLDISEKRRVAAILLLILSPIVYYINYICYEAFVFSMVTMSLVAYATPPREKEFPSWKTKSDGMPEKSLRSSITKLLLSWIMHFCSNGGLFDGGKGKDIFARCDWQLHDGAWKE